DIIIGNQGDLYRIPFGTSTPSLLASGLGGYLSNVTFDVNGDIICTVLQANRLIRIDAVGTVTDIMPPGSVLGPNAVDQDNNLDWIVGGTGGQVFRVPYVGGSAVLIGTNTFPSTSVSGVAVVGGSVSGSWNAFGNTCNGQFGRVTLGITGSMSPGGTFNHVSDNHAPGQLGVAIFGLSSTSYSGNPLPYLLDPMLGTNNCFLNVAIDATQVGFTTAASPATLSFSITIPAGGTGGASFFLQHACFEPVAGGTSWSNGVVVFLP
ncbi:MAG: hypothetical protein KDC98_13695, partial [Planctomycetes bacterium]|nr:hypothetical protein [Planctomycetota bacterium]